MFRKFEKTLRIRVPQINVGSKKFLSRAETKKLLNGKLTITEKVDGANTAIIRTKNWFKLQKRGSLVGTSEHEQYNFFKAWADKNYEKILKIDTNYIVYGELLRIVHTIYYDKLPDWFLVFAIWNKKNSRYLSWDLVSSLCDDWGLSTVPRLAEDVYLDRDELFDFIPEISKVGSLPSEGIIVWNFKKQMRGKVVREEFIKKLEIGAHWTKKQSKYNSLIER
jgi:ATP-dependent RNA circularization protein (DNA/RNA ligase family)